MEQAPFPFRFLFIEAEPVDTTTTEEQPGGLTKGSSRLPGQIVIRAKRGHSYTDSGDHK